MTSQLNIETYVFAARGIKTCRSQGVDVLVRHTIIFSEIYFIELFDVFIYLLPALNVPPSAVTIGCIVYS